MTRQRPSVADGRPTPPTRRRNPAVPTDEQAADVARTASSAARARASRRTEIVRGRKPGHGLRAARPGERTPTSSAATKRGRYRRPTAPRRHARRAARVWQRVRRVVVGSPIASEEHEEQRLPKSKALAVFSSDALSSSAYATDEILLVLVDGRHRRAHACRCRSRSRSCLLLAVVTFSYRQTIRAYPSGGGAYIVARDNLGDIAGITAAAGLSVGYILTVAVSIAAGVFAVDFGVSRRRRLQGPASRSPRSC